MIMKEQDRHLTAKNLLGIYPKDDAGYIQLEHQIGSRLIWTMCPEGMSQEQAIAVTNQMLPELWSNIPQAIACAEQYSRETMPEFWIIQDESDVIGERLDVWSIRLFPDQMSSEYYVSTNHDLILSDEDLKYPDTYGMTVCRDVTGTLSVR